MIEVELHKLPGGIAQDVFEMPVPAVEGVVGEVELLLTASLAHFLLQYRCTLVVSTNFGFCPHSYKGGMRQRLKAIPIESCQIPHTGPGRPPDSQSYLRQSSLRFLRMTLNST